MLFVFDLLKIAASIAAIVLGHFGPFTIDERPHLDVTVATFGWILFVHECFVWARALVKLRSKKWTERFCDWATSRLDPAPGSETVPEKRFALEGDKQMLTWLVMAAGIILGLVSFSQAETALVVQKVGAGALVVSIVSGILYINLMAGAILKEESYELAVEKFGHELAIILLNVAYWSFALGVLSIFFAIVSLPASP